ncbi:MAG: DEAD/DEAH box helicase [Clostridium chrysemydis]|uniref:DEAD/DEAH box helicase n=1 Tax=Clostridium chrysemydis TaxID=2665504 RepID=UPI003F2C53B4
MIERLAQEAFGRSYFWKLYEKINVNSTKKILQLDSEILENKELTDILRFADIFSNSNDEEFRNLSYRILSRLNDEYCDNIIYNSYANAILKRLNNFPALKNIKNIDLPINRELQYLADKQILKIPYYESMFFLPNQYVIFNNLRDEQSITFSGPTSMGKSFLIKHFIIDMIKNKKNYNVAIIVPTRALIKQYVIDINKDLKELNLLDYKVITNANILEFLDLEKEKFIFVLTQERLNVLIYNKNNIKLDYLIVDEAYKTFDENIRGLTLYSTINSCMLKFRNMKVVFASPLINNPNIFRDTFKQSMESLNFREAPVTQNLFFIDLKQKYVEKIKDINKEKEIRIDNYIGDKNELFYKLGRDTSNIVYLSGKDRTIQYANEFVVYIERYSINLLTKEEKEKIEKLCELITKSVHKDLFLIKTLKKGIAYHYGKLPNIIRESIELLFKQGVIKYIFCTSTLLEGVNLPAKNIFIMANFNGNSKMKPLEFWNLAGRAGRLGYEYYGNIFCVKDYEHNNAWKDKSVLYSKKDILVDDNLDHNITKEKERLTNNLKTEEVAKGLNDKDKYINYLSNIIEIDNLSNNKTLILDKVNKIEPQLLQKEGEKELFDYNLVNSNKTIDYKIQYDMYKQEELPKITILDYENILAILNFMYEHYRWDLKEKNLRYKNSLKYIANLMNKWINGVQLSEIINKSITYYSDNGRKILISQGALEIFDKTNPYHINALINNIIFDIEDILRFDLEKYFNHYYNLLELKYGEGNIGVNIALYLEFGTRNTKEIILQNSGFSRYVSNILNSKYSKYLLFEDNIFKGIDRNILVNTDFKENSIVNNEVKISSYILN